MQFSLVARDDRALADGCRRLPGAIVTDEGTWAGVEEISDTEIALFVTGLDFNEFQEKKSAMEGGIN